MTSTVFFRIKKEDMETGQESCHRLIDNVKRSLMDFTCDNDLLYLPYLWSKEEGFRINIKAWLNSSKIPMEKMFYTNRCFLWNSLKETARLISDSTEADLSLSCQISRLESEPPLCKNHLRKWRKFWNPSSSVKKLSMSPWHLQSPKFCFL